MLTAQSTHVLPKAHHRRAFGVAQEIRLDTDRRQLVGIPSVNVSATVAPWCMRDQPNCVVRERCAPART